MDFDANFKYLGATDTARLRALVDVVDQLTWQEYQFRQKTFAVHQATETIPLIFDEDFRHSAPTAREHWPRFQPAVVPILEAVRACYPTGGWVARVLLTRLVPGGHIPTHRDSGYSLLRAHRVHVPIVTAPACAFTVGGETQVMREGELWELNNARPHSVTNSGRQHRVHLIVDWCDPGLADDELIGRRSPTRHAADRGSRG